MKYYFYFYFYLAGGRLAVRAARRSEKHRKSIPGRARQAARASEIEARRGRSSAQTQPSQAKTAPRLFFPRSSEQGAAQKAKRSL